MKVTVFGGSGFLGSHICDKLSDAGHDVTIVDVRPSPWLRDDQKMVVGSILDEDCVQAAVEGAEVVFNYAGIADIGEANERPVDTARLNVVGNVMVLEACRRALDYARANPALLRQLEQTGRLAINELAAGSQTEKKTLERHRKYLVAILLAFTNGYEIIRGHLCQIGPGKGGKTA